MVPYNEMIVNHLFYHIITHPVNRTEYTDCIHSRVVRPLPPPKKKKKKKKKKSVQDMTLKCILW